MALKRGLALLEHVNLNVPRRADAVRFYGDALGGALHPRGTQPHQVHFNLGLGQVHAPFASPPPGGVGPPVTDLVGGGDSVAEEHDARWVGEPQVLDGHVELWVRELEASRERLQAAGVVPREVPEGLEVRCPWGNRLVLREAPPHVVEQLGGAGELAGGGGATCVGIARVEFRCPLGTVAGIGRFYEEYLGAEVEHEDGAVHVHAGPSQLLSFRESSDVDPEAYSRDTLRCGYHVCVYVHGWEDARDKVAAAGLVHASERFAELDAALTPTQFRLLRLVDPQTGDLLIELEHEIRSLASAMCPLEQPMAKS